MTMGRLGYFVGSLAAAFINRTLPRALIRLAPPQLQFAVIGINNLSTLQRRPRSPPGGRPLRLITVQRAMLAELAEEAPVTKGGLPEPRPASPLTRHEVVARPRALADACKHTLVMKGSR